jgi:hypothetical protein
MKGTFRIVRVRTKYGYSFNGTSFKEEKLFRIPIRTISQGRPNNSLRETNFRRGHLNQKLHF